MQNFPLDSWFWCIYNFFIFLQVSFKNSPARHTIPHKREENTAWEDIRKLDEEQNWTERTQVVTKEEHNFYTETAKVRNEEFSSTEYWSSCPSLKCMFILILMLCLIFL